MAALIEAITVKRKMYFEFENTPYYCMEAEVSTPTARGGQTLDPIFWTRKALRRTRSRPR